MDQLEKLLLACAGGDGGEQGFNALAALAVADHLEENGRPTEAGHVRTIADFDFFAGLDAAWLEANGDAWDWEEEWEAEHGEMFIPIPGSPHGLWMGNPGSVGMGIYCEVDESPSEERTSPFFVLLDACQSFDEVGRDRRRVVSSEFLRLTIQEHCWTMHNDARVPIIWSVDLPMPAECPSRVLRYVRAAAPHFPTLKLMAALHVCGCTPHRLLALCAAGTGETKPARAKGRKAVAKPKPARAKG